MQVLLANKWKRHQALVAFWRHEQTRYLSKIKARDVPLLPESGPEVGVHYGFIKETGRAGRIVAGRARTAATYSGEDKS